VKILDKYLLKTFLSTFTTVFVILFFIFILQTVWLFIGELAGKDLDLILILKFLLFKMPTLVPLFLPLSILLASIMTFGTLSENYEFAAMKSSGISLKRAMRSLTIFILLLSIVTFLFANNVIPYAEYKFINFRRNIAQVKPAMAIAEGQFSDVGAYNIKVEKKSGENGTHLDQVTIHKKSQMGSGSNTVIKAKKGELISNEDSNILKLVLFDGNYYEDIIPKKFEDRKNVPFAKSKFKQYVINIDLSKLNTTDINDEQITNKNTMLTIGELQYTLDSLNNNYKKDMVSYTENIYVRTGIANITTQKIGKEKIPKSNKLLLNYTNSQQQQILKVACSTVDASNFSIESSQFEMENKVKTINEHWIAFYDKFVIAFACFLMFFIGAPLGAIIRKGGLGLPIVFAILIFIIFHFINTFGKKVAGENGISPFLGCWMSTFVLTPLAIILTKRATDDKGFTINMDFITQPIQKLYQKIFPSEE
jgi:lipopolysaccharide export system permease protein